MSLFNPSRNELNFKIIVDGPITPAKNECIHHIYGSTREEFRGHISSFPTPVTPMTPIVENVLSCDIRLATEIDGKFLRLWFFSLPGAPFQHVVRLGLAKGVDGVLFLATAALDAESNVAAWDQLEDLLEQCAPWADEVPRLLLLEGNENIDDDSSFAEVLEIASAQCVATKRCICGRAEDFVHALQTLLAPMIAGARA